VSLAQLVVRLLDHGQLVGFSNERVRWAMRRTSGSPLTDNERTCVSNMPMNRALGYGSQTGATGKSQSWVKRPACFALPAEDAPIINAQLLPPINPEIFP
jgi:hypothetical protein